MRDYPSLCLHFKKMAPRFLRKQKECESAQRLKLATYKDLYTFEKDSERNSKRKRQGQSLYTSLNRGN